MLSCREVVGLASDLIDRRLRARDCLALAVHAAMCRGCRAYLAQMRLTVAVLGRLPRPAPPLGAAGARVVARLRRASGSPPAYWAARRGVPSVSDRSR